MRAALDSNVLVYAEGVNGAARRAAALFLMRQLRGAAAELVAPAQALGELYNVLVRKSGRPADDARRMVLAWRDNVIVAPTTGTAIIAAVDLAADHRLSIWDSVILAVAAENGCRLLLSEDMQDGFTWGGVTVANPFAASRHPLLAALLAVEEK